MKKVKFQSPVGMHDILPVNQKYFNKVYKICQKFADFYNFQKIDTPILENKDVFEKGTGNSTDIVQKEMYTFKTKGGDYLTLRPEGTPAVVRSYIEHGMNNLPQPVKLWYFGQFFRHERPQAGRYRQFWQFGLEVLGEKSALIDAQIIQIFYNILKELGLKNLVIEINSIGDKICRPRFKKVLIKYLKSKISLLCPDCRRKLRENPLRILDCKELRCQEVTASAPQNVDYLCEFCHKHFTEVLEFLDEIGLPYRLNPHLVRGLDYYTRTVFEICEELDNGKSQESLAGGGRYDDLIKFMGSKKDISACGGACGIERIINLIKPKEAEVQQVISAKVFLAQLGDLAKKKSLNLLDDFRKEKIKVIESLGRDSLKSQLKMANKVGAKYVLILGQKEALSGEIMVRDMDSRSQETVKMDQVVQKIKKLLK